MAMKKRVSKHRQRARVREELVQRGFSIEERSGRGILPGARLLATRDNETVDVAVRASLERSLGFSRKPDGDWRTLESADWLAAIVPAAGKGDRFQILFFEASRLIPAFDKALSAMRKENRAPSLEMPIYIPLDPRSRKNVGHQENGLAALAMWDPVEVEIDGAEPVVAGTTENFIQRVKREFAEINQVDISKVQVEFKIVD